MEKKEYNGWYNYETWLCALWMDNDGSTDYYREQAQEAFEGYLAEHDGDVEQATQDTVEYLESMIRDGIEENAPEMGNGFYADVLNAAIREVNFREIAEHYADDLEVPEELDENDD